MKKLISLLLCGALLLSGLTPAAAATNTLTMTSSSPITSGATLEQYTWDISDGNVKAAVLKLDLNDPYVQLEVVPGGGKFTQRASVSAMADRTDAIAMVNGDYYNMRAEGAPIGATVIDGELVSSQSFLNGVYCLGITEDRTAKIEQFSFSGSVTAANGEKRNLSGLNKTFYWEETTGLHSHVGRLHLYTDLWGGNKRGMDEYVGTPAEVLVKDGVVTDVAFEGGFDSAVPEGCYLLHGDGQAATYLAENFQVGESVDIQYTYKPEDSWQMVVGGHALLVDQGQTVPYTKDLSALGGVRARTAAGISKDGKTVYIVAVEGRTKASKGITLGNLSLLMTKLGVWKAVNLDGGGSTTMVARPLAETTRTRIINPESNGSERRVVEGLGVYSTAPAGSVRGIFIDGPKTLLLGETGQYTLKAYDQYYNPVTDLSVIELTDAQGLGRISGNQFTAQQVGSTEITAVNGSQTASLPVTVVSGDSLQALRISIDSTEFADGSVHQLKAEATLEDGTVKEVSPQVLDWSVEGFDGTIDETGKLTIGTLGDAVKGTVRAAYDGFGGELQLQFVDQTLRLTIGSTTLRKGSETMEMDVPPQLVGDRTMVPVRFVAEALGGKVDWSDAEQRAYIVYNDNIVEVPVQSAQIYVNGEAVQVDAPAQILGGRTMLPLRAVAEGLGLAVDYEDATRSITISQK